MRKTILAVLIMLPNVAGAIGVELRRADAQMTNQCQTVGTGAATEFFNLSSSTNSRVDQKFVIIQSLDVTYSSNSVRISSWATSTDGDGFPLVGFAQPLKLEAGPNTRIFIRRSTGQLPNPNVCVGSWR